LKTKWRDEEKKNTDTTRDGRLQTRKIQKLSAHSDYGACFSGLGDDEMMDMPAATFQEIKQEMYYVLSVYGA
jgi:hypothetical protein